MSPDTPRYVGIDLGLTTIKVVIYDGSRYSARMASASWNPAGMASSLLAPAVAEFGLVSPPTLFATTGHDRRTLPMHSGLTNRNRSSFLLS
jgi:predicted NBD/HSP70 family sugar kinase